MTHAPRGTLYDVCIIGSGAGGGMAAYMLTRAGAEVLLLEAGGAWDNTVDSAMLTWAHDSPRRGASTSERPFGEFDACIGGWNLPGEPFTRAPGTRFDWWRARMLGGRTNHWGRISLRFGPRDFKGRSRDPDVVDQWGIPVLQFHWRWSDHEINQVRHMQETFRALVAAMGGEVWSPMPTREQGYGIATGGSIIHELGCVRMGSDPAGSVLNAQCQAWDVKNLFVADGGPFVSQADKNPTWTILALSMRTSDYIARAMKRNEL